jgi:hypothetical protein
MVTKDIVVKSKRRLIAIAFVLNFSPRRDFSHMANITFVPKTRFSMSGGLKRRKIITHFARSPVNLPHQNKTIPLITRLGMCARATLKKH